MKLLELRDALTRIMEEEGANPDAKVVMNCCGEHTHEAADPAICSDGEIII